MTELQSLFIRGMRDFFPASDKEILTEISNGVQDGRYKVFLHDFDAFCILYMPQNVFDVPQVLYFYSEKPGIRHALVGQVLDFVKKKGYNRLRATNGSGASDDIWTRAFKHEGWEIKPVQTVFDFEVKA